MGIYKIYNRNLYGVYKVSIGYIKRVQGVAGNCCLLDFFYVISIIIFRFSYSLRTLTVSFRIRS